MIDESHGIHSAAMDTLRDNFTSLAERSVKRELIAHLDDMAVFKVLQHISRDRLLAVACESDEVRPSSEVERGNESSRELVASFSDLMDRNTACVSEASVKHTNPSTRDGVPFGRNHVSVVTCESHITTQLHGEVLMEYDTVWAFSTVTLAVDLDATTRRQNHNGVLTRGATTAKERVLVRINMESMHLVNRQHAAKETERQAVLNSKRDINSGDETLSSRDGAESKSSEMRKIADDLDDGNSWFAIQSVSIPERPLDLQCYSRHMVHFGLLCYALWFSGRPNECGNALLRYTQSYEESYRALMALFPHAVTRLARQKFASEMHSKPIVPEVQLHDKRCRVSDVSENDPLPVEHRSTNKSGLDLFARNLALPIESDTPILILGLGGNVIGSCLDRILPACVPIDIIELEPTVVRACEMHGTLPALVSDQPIELRTASESFAAAQALCAQRSHPRHPYYRVFVGEVSNTLPRLGSSGTSGNSHAMYYRMIFLDCYDPQRETMMCEGSLLQQCRERLCPQKGGVLIVNAHITPTRESLQPFEACRFDSVQVLRVLGCDQCILACVCTGTEATTTTSTIPHSADTESGMASSFPVSDRFTVPSIRHMGRCINQLWERDECMEKKNGHRYPFREYFPLDADWFQSSRAFAGCDGDFRLWQLNP